MYRALRTHHPECLPALQRVGGFPEGIEAVGNEAVSFAYLNRGGSTARPPAMSSKVREPRSSNDADS